MTDSDLEIRAEVDHSDPKMGGRGGGPSPKTILPQFRQTVRGGRTPGPSPGSATEEGRCMLESLSVSFVTGCGRDRI